MYLLNALIGLVLFGILFLIYGPFKRKSKYILNMKGPKPIPIFGNTLDFFNISTVEFFNLLLRYHKENGDTILLNSGSKPFIVTKEAEFTELILNSTKFIEKSPEYKYFHNWLGTGLLTSTGAKWKHRRRILTPAFHFSILEQYIEVFDSVSEILVEKLQNYDGLSNCNVYPLITLYALDVICEAIMGTSVNAQHQNLESPYVAKVKTMLEIIPRRSTSPLADIFYPLTKRYYDEKSALKLLHQHTNYVIDARIKSRENRKIVIDLEPDSMGIKKKCAFLDLLLDYKANGESLTREDIREEVDTFMFEGHDTTSSAIAFAVYCLANNPAVQEKVFEEQMKVLGGEENVKMTAQLLNEMKYLELVIKETLRLYPSVPIFARQASEDFEYGGNLIPKNISVFMFVFAMQRDEKLFPNPEAFIPERFETKHENPFQYVPFSAGSRNCIGQKFAMYEMKCTLSKIVRNFVLYPSKNDNTLSLACETILISKNGVNIALSKRQTLKYKQDHIFSTYY